MTRRFPRWAWLSVVAVGTLAFAGVAIANHVSASTAAVSATFTATTVSERTTTACTGADGAYEVTYAKYTGTAVSSDTRLDGPIELRVKSTYNTTESLGWLKAHVRILDADGRTEARGVLQAVNVNGQAEGLLDGEVRGPRGKLLGNVSAAFTGAAGFSNGQLGAGSTANTAILYDGGCRPGWSGDKKDDRKGKHGKDERKHDRGWKGGKHRR